MDCRLHLFLTALLIGTVYSDSQILILKNYLNGTTTSVSNAEDGASLYVASNDKADYLKNIAVNTGGVTYLLSDLAQPNSDGTSKKTPISGGLTITTTNPNTVTYTLTGYLYLTTAQQAQDSSFSVYAITGNHHISTTGTRSTVVILNTQLQATSGDADQPQKSSYVSEIQQDANSTLYFQWGVPPVNYTNTVNNKFFENPVNIVNSDQTTTTKFFSNVEPLQIGIDYWYFTAIGSVNLRVQNNFVGDHVYNTTAADTTGLLINSNTFFYQHVVNFQQDPTRSRTVGTFISATIPRQVQVNFVLADAAGKVSTQTFDNTKNSSEIWSTYSLNATQLTVNSTDSVAGVFYCQYFIFSNDASATTPSAPVTQPSGQTTAIPITGSTVTSVTTAASKAPNNASSTAPSSTTPATTTQSSRSLFTFDLFSLFITSLSAELKQLSDYTSVDPVSISNVEDGSNLYLVSSDKAKVLSEITLVSNGQSIIASELLGRFDDNGYQKGWPVGKDLMIGTFNTENVTKELNGLLFISSPDMAKDPNFLVYVVKDQTFTVDRSENAETTLVLLNQRVSKTATDPVYKSFYNTRVENFVQPNTTKLYIYRSIPGDGYTDPTYKETVGKLIFTNPVSLLPTENPDANTVFFDNIEPIQYSLMSWHIRAIGGIKFNVSRNWVDQSTYQTTKETTTGYTMSQLFTYNTTVNLKNNPNHDGTFGMLLTTTELFADVDITMCSGTVECQSLPLDHNVGVVADFFQWSQNTTNLYIVPTKVDSGIYYIQYFRIEGNLLSSLTTVSSSVPTTTTQSVPTTTQSVANGSSIYLTSSDKAAYLARITLSTGGQTITFDDDGFQIGWPVYNDLTISTTNNENITKELRGNLFVATPTMAQDPNFLVYVVRSSRVIDRSDKDNSTIVFLNVRNTNDGNPIYKGFTHTRIHNIVQPETTGLCFYRGEPDDYYGDLNDEHTLVKRIFSNPLQVSSTGDPSKDYFFFNNVDPIQYSLQVWFMKAIGGIRLDVSDEYVDTTSIQATAVTTTGLANSQLFNYNSSVSFISSGDNLGISGWSYTTELYSNTNLTLTLNGKGDLSESETVVTANLFSHFYKATWPAENIGIYPSQTSAGIYWIQYFKVDQGPVTTTPALPSSSSTSSTSKTAAPTTSSIVSSAATSAATPAPTTPSASTATQSTTQNVETTTQSASTSSIFLLFGSTFARIRLADISITGGFITLPVEKGANLYVQSNDDEGLLGKIKITNNLNTKTALELSKMGTNLDGTKTAWQITGEVTISSTNTEMEAERLTGFVYFTTYTQANDKSFLVYAVDRNTVISYNVDDLTLVFLNQNLGLENQPLYVPEKSSQVYEYLSSADGNVFIYWDEPTESYKNENADDSKQRIIFQNPLYLTTWQFFDSVEPFQIFSDVWYVRAKGQIRFQVRPKWDDPNGTATTKVTTTGLVTCSFAPENLTIHMAANPENAAVAGFYVLYNVIYPVRIGIDAFQVGIDTQNTTRYNRQGGWGETGTKSFQILSQYDIAGRYAVQYFQIEGAPLPTTTPGPSTTSQTIVSRTVSTTTTVPTTTRAASGMTRHGKNSTASSVYTYHERRRDAKASGYGTLHARLGADSIKEFHCCSLTLQPCRTPVVSPDGFIFDREAILENILAQKKAYAKKLKEYEKQVAEESAARQTEGQAEVLTKRTKFSAIESTPSRTGASATPRVESGSLKRPGGVISSEIAAKVKAHGEEGDMSNMRGAKSTSLPSFWIPELNPTAAASKLEKPRSKTLCPVSGKPIKMKELMEVQFTPMPGTETAAKRRFVCPVTRDELTNTTRCAYLKKSKAVVKYDVVEKLIKGDGVDPINGEPISEGDIIELQRGGTGYAATNEVKAKLIRPQLELQ
ncbi:unnamed protein product [Caenorhabditis sp. 36 PRJEB53466]|nr:unnamed protein product [Caenorhabditis sp. 36 PRJEB53466]